MHLTRRHASIAVLALACSTAFAQDKYPTKPVTVIVPQAPGGANDAIARIVAQKPTRLTINAFVPASTFAGSANQKPMSRYEHKPTPSHPTNSTG